MGIELGLRWLVMVGLQHERLVGGMHGCKLRLGVVELNWGVVGRRVGWEEWIVRLSRHGESVWVRGSKFEVGAQTQLMRQRKWWHQV